MGPQGAWARPLPLGQKVKENDYESMLEETKGPARSIVDTVSMPGDDCVRLNLTIICFVLIFPYLTLALNRSVAFQKLKST